MLGPSVGATFPIGSSWPPRLLDPELVGTTGIEGAVEDVAPVAGAVDGLGLEVVAVWLPPSREVCPADKPPRGRSPEGRGEVDSTV